MSSGPITYLEIDAYDRRMFMGLSAWGIGLIRRIDDAILAMVADQAPEPNDTTGSGQIPASDIKGIKAMFRGLAAKKVASKT